MNAPGTHDVGNSTAGFGLFLLRSLLVVAWVFNFVTLAATVLHAWRSGNPGSLLGVGFVTLWLLGLGVITWRTCRNSAETAAV
jgi:hypothetical protein